MLLPHRLVDLIVQISNHEITQTRILDLADFARDLLQHLAAPFFT